MPISFSVTAIVCGALLMAAGLLVVMAPALDQVPPLEWRANYGAASWCLGAVSGIGFWQFAAYHLRWLRDEV